MVFKAQITEIKQKNNGLDRYFTLKLATNNEMIMALCAIPADEEVEVTIGEINDTGR